MKNILTLEEFKSIQIEESIINEIEQLNEKELSEKQKAYREHYNAMLKKYESEHVGTMDVETKGRFFKELSSTWNKETGKSEIMDAEGNHAN